MIYLCKLGGDVLATTKRKRKRNRNSRKAKRRLFIFAPISVIIIGYFMISTTNYVLNIMTLNREAAELKQNLVILKEDEENLKNEIQKLKDPDYIARFARENYLYSKNGEYIIKITDKNNKKKNNKNTINDLYLKYVTAGCGVFALLVVIWMIHKK